MTSVCDATADCSPDLGNESEDEDYCAGCDGSAFFCALSYKCTASIKVCDGIANCYYGEDEAFCGQNNCSTGQYECSSGDCVSGSTVCDGQKDCPDGDDEPFYWCLE